jgi:hypothetical protein
VNTSTVPLKSPPSRNNDDDDDDDDDDLPISFNALQLKQHC